MHRLRLLLVTLAMLVVASTTAALVADPFATAVGLAASATHAYDRDASNLSTLDMGASKLGTPAALVRASLPRADGTSLSSGVPVVAAEGGADAAAARGPSFIVHPNGEAVPIPEGATGPTSVSSGNGVQFSGGSGASWLDPRVAGVRVMDPVTSGKYLYPNGYVSYFNEAGQTVNPFTGQTIARSDPFWHWEWGP
jgi:hypothetical protein